MKIKTTVLAILAVFAFISAPAMAASEHEVTGVVQGVNKSSRTVKIKHGPIKSMNMAGMTMDFKVADPSMLSEVKTGQKIDFVITQNRRGQFVIQDLTVSDAHASN